MGHALTLTLIRTSCVLLEYDGLHAITDPWFDERMRGLPVFRRPGIPLERLPKIDYVFASHLHGDHYDREAITRFAHADLEVVGTRGTRHWSRFLPVKAVHDLWHWESHTLGPFTLTATPAVHTGPPPEEVNFVIDFGPWRIFFGGDARLSDAHREIAERYPGGFDLALLPVGGTLIFGHRTTMDPNDAVTAAQRIDARRVVPIHEGGEWMPVPPASWHPGRFRHFAAAARQRAPSIEPLVLKPGEPITLPPP